MNKKPYTKFGPWFKAQFGRDVLTDRARIKLEKEALAAAFKSSRLERQNLEEDRFDDIHDAALKGWVAGYEAGKLDGAKQ